MIMRFVMANLRWILLGIGVLFALAWLYSFITASPKAEARLGKNQTGAALESGRDAVGAVGRQQAGEAAIDRTTKENDDAIRNAPGADAPVDGRAAAAGVSSLCKRASAARDPKCLQHTSPR